MLLEKLDSQALLWITTLVGKTTTPGLSAFRSDLVSIEGAIPKARPIFVIAKLRNW